MAKNCGCGNATCGCSVIQGEGIVISGTGTKADPYVIQAELATLGSVISFQDTSTIDMTVLGAGTPSDPYIVSATVKAAPFPAYTTAGRPSAASLPPGAFYYDTTLSKPLWTTGAVWKDAAGTTI